MSNALRTSAGEPLITRKTSFDAVRCSSASCSSRRSRPTSISSVVGEIPRQFGVFAALLRFNLTGLRRRDLAVSPPTLERRFITSPYAESTKNS